MNCPVGMVGPVPKGLDDRSQAIYCLESVQSRIRPVGHGLILTHGGLGPDRSASIGPNHTVPYGTVPVFARIPVPKGLQDSARGFNPGYRLKTAPPSKGGREFVPVRVDPRHRPTRSTAVCRPFGAGLLAVTRG
jgi:hypothetical protein